MRPINSKLRYAVSAAGLARCAMGVAALNFAMPSDAAQLEEVIVTAQKREQSMMDVPISVSALTGQKITDSGINNLADLSGFVPGLHIGKGPINTTINIRGIGSGIDRGFEQSVGMYIDGLYMGRSRLFRSPFLDLKRVEVLRGPQGILFGKNTIAGVINIISSDPMLGDDNEARVSLKVEDYGTMESEGVFSTSLTDTFGARLALKYREYDGEIDNVYLGQDEPEAEELSGRLTLLWEPADTFSLNTKIAYTDYSTDGINAVPTSSDPVPGNTDPLAAAAFALSAAVAPDQNLNDSHEAWRDDSTSWSGLNKISGWGGGTGVVPEQTDTQATNIGVTANWYISDAWTLTSVTGYSEYESDDATDADFVPIRLLLTRDAHEYDQVSQELRFSFLGRESIEFVGGLYYEQQDLTLASGTIIDGTMDGVVPPALLNNIFAALTAPSIAAAIPSLPSEQVAALAMAVSPQQIARFNDFDQESETAAAFGEITWMFADNWQLSLGGRYSVESKEVQKRLTIQNNVDGFDVVSPALPCLTPATSLTPGCIAYGAWGSSFGTRPHNFDVDSGDDDFFDPSAKLQWDINSDHMVYLSYSEGHKSGGFNASSDAPVQGAPSIDSEGGLTYTTPGEKFEYDAETAKSLELGYKGVLVDGAVQLNAAVFATDYSDLQVAIFQGTNFTVENAAQADLMGVEVELRWAATDSLELGGSLAYLDFEFDEYSAGCTIDGIVAAANIDRANGDPKGTTACRQDLSGERNAFAPEYSGNLFADYSRDVFSNLLLKATLDLNFKSEMYLDYDLDERVRQAGYGKVNARISLSNENWEFAIFGRNLGDKTTHSFALDTPLLSGATTGWVDEGRIYGAELRWVY